MARLAKALKRPGIELRHVTFVRNDVITDRSLGQNVVIPTHPAERFDRELIRAKLPPTAAVVKMLPSFGFGRTLPWLALAAISLSNPRRTEGLWRVRHQIPWLQMRSARQQVHADGRNALTMNYVVNDSPPFVKPLDVTFHFVSEKPGITSRKATNIA